MNPASVIFKDDDGAHLRVFSEVEAAESFRAGLSAAGGSSEIHVLAAGEYEKHHRHTLECRSCLLLLNYSGGENRLNEAQMDLPAKCPSCGSLQIGLPS